MNSKNSLLIIGAYFLMIAIWSTTPLAIQWSSQGVDFITGLFLRMLIGSVLALALTLLWYKTLPLHQGARRVYMASALAIYGAMMLVYWGAQYINSGLVSVLYGLSPIFSGFFSVLILQQNDFSYHKMFGTLLGVFGLAIIFTGQIHYGELAILGILATLFSALLHSASAVWIKRLNTPLPALIVTTGGLVFAMPLFLLTFLLFAEPLPEALPSRTFWSILYLGSIGSVIGFVSYYFVLARLQPTTVALATLITPVIALLLGTLFNEEHITLSIFWGTSLIMMALLIHQLYERGVEIFFARAGGIFTRT